MNHNSSDISAELADLIIISTAHRVLEKVVFSKPDDTKIKKSEMRMIKLSKSDALQLEIFTSDNKARHRNIIFPCGQNEIGGIIGGYRQINLFTSVGNCEYRKSKSGNAVILGDKNLHDIICSGPVSNVEIHTNDRKKAYILSGDEPFLKLLGVSDAGGRVYDKKKSKFRQINKFLEHIEQVEKYLPEDRIRICDLCCGKSYLSFAVYHYFAEIKKMNVSMTGVDLKRDVIEYCSQIAKELSFDGLEFVCGDIKDYATEELPELVVSLHACDTATDIVLDKAMEWHADVILSTPCCHHELNHTLNCPELEFISKYSMLRQKLCDAATDAMRLKLLEANGYNTAALELIDPEETPKNIMLRAVRKKNFDCRGEEARRLKKEYDDIKNFLVRPC